MEDDNVSPIEHLGPFYDENCYPYHIMSEMGLFPLDFEPLTILYGGNGSPQKYDISKITTVLTNSFEYYFDALHYKKIKNQSDKQTQGYLSN